MRSEWLLILLLVGWCVGCNLQESTETASNDGTGMSPVAGAGGIDLGGTMGGSAPVQPSAPPSNAAPAYPAADMTPSQPAAPPAMQPGVQPQSPSTGQQLPFNLPPALRPVGPGSNVPNPGTPAAPGAGVGAPGAATPRPSGDARKAGVGVGKRGRSLDNMSGVIVQPAKSLFAFQERAVFQIQIPQALQLFEATNGRKPKSHDEYMASIIKANKIKLPELPQGQKYHYDVQRGELMVYKPRQ